MTVTYERTGAAAVVTIDRPERRNAVDGPTAEALNAAYHRFEADDSRVLVLTGADDAAVSAGADLKNLESLAGRIHLPEGPDGFTRHTPGKPTMAAVNSWCAARALEHGLFVELTV